MLLITTMRCTHDKQSYYDTVNVNSGPLHDPFYPTEMADLLKQKGRAKDSFETSKRGRTFCQQYKNCIVNVIAAPQSDS